ncbi:MAG TPA: SelB C-terminal domain-containing protein, partial [Longimicrobiales bacterium]|nr:SelB C-terminal domain-containing protein [Longimicrobiales bacterium]
APGEVEVGIRAAREGGALEAEGRWVGQEAVESLAAALLERLEAAHRDEPFRSGLPVEQLRALTPRGAPRGFADAVLARLAQGGALTVTEGVVARAGFEPTLTAGQEALREGLRTVYRDAGLQPPALDALPEAMRGDPAFPHLLKGLEAEGELVPVDADLYVWGPALVEAGARIVAELGGREGLGPADFKEVLPVSRRYLLPILRHFDGAGITRNNGDVRTVLLKDS